MKLGLYYRDIYMLSKYIEKLLLKILSCNYVRVNSEKSVFRIQF